MGIPVQKQNGQEQRVGSSACLAQTRRLRETTHTHTHTHTPHVQNTWGGEMDKLEKPAHLHRICRIRIRKPPEGDMQVPRDRPVRCRKIKDT